MSDTELKDETKVEAVQSPLFSRSLPPAFTDFLSRNSIPLELFTESVTLQRFIRLNPRAIINRESLQTELSAKLDPTPLQQFLALDSNIQIADKQAYKNGSIYGMDLASGVSVLALDPQPSDHVLDLCCAPGNKLCMIADFMINKFCETMPHVTPALSTSSNALSRLPANINLPGSVTGVDWHYQRLAATRSLLRKYQLTDYVRLFLCDGQTFHASPPPSLSSNSKPIWRGQIIDLMNSTAASSSSSSNSSSSNATDVASTEGFHCASALTSSVLQTADGSMLRLTKREKQAIRKREAKQAWEEKLKKRKLDEQNNAVVEAPVETTMATIDAMATESSSAELAEIPSSREIATTSTDTTAATETTTSNVPQFYDRVLVDAECTHDGSFKHITKFYTESTATPSSSTVTAGSEASWQEFETKFLNPARMESLQLLQRNLIWNGFERLKVGGTLVYSTCSYSRKQNEEIIAWLLVKARGSAQAVHVFDGVPTFSSQIVQPAATSSPEQMLHQIEELKLSAELQPLRYRLGQLDLREFVQALPTSETEHNPFVEAALPSTSNSQKQVASIEWGIRMDPIVSQTSGLYIAKIQKLH